LFALLPLVARIPRISNDADYPLSAAMDIAALRC
jgi:hypothetical protein